MRDKNPSVEIDNMTEGEGLGRQPKRKGKWVRYVLRALLVLLFVVCLAVSAVIIWLGPIAERCVEEYDMELVGHRVEMDNLRIKLFKGRVDVDNLVLYEADATTEFVRMGHLATTMALMELLDEHVHITSVGITQPRVGITQQGDEFNFDTLVDYILAKYTDDEVEEVESDTSWRVSIDNVTLEDGDLAYWDKEIDQHWDIASIGLSTPAIILDDAVSDIAVSMTINDKATIGGALGLNCSTLDFGFDGELAGFDLADTYKYIKPTINVKDVQGRVAADVVIDGNVGDIMAMNIKGDIAADDLAVAGPDGGNLFSAKRVDAGIYDLNISEERFIFSCIMASDYATELHFRKDGTTNFSNLFYGEPEVSVETQATAIGDDMYEVQERVTVTTSEEVAPFSDLTLRIGLLDLQGGELKYSDKTMHEDFDYMLRKIAIQCSNFDLKERNKITLRMSLPKQGSALLQWDGSLSDFYNQSLMAMLTNVDMPGLSTYLEHFTAFPITSGNMTFRSQNVVTNGKLSGVNQLGTYQFALGKKDKSMDVEYNLPLKFGVYVLTDKNDHIDVDIPITGDIDSPEFSYRKIILKAIGNLLLKIVAAPFQWMSPEKQDAFQGIDVDLLTPGLDSEHYARLDKMAEALREDATLKVRLTQRVNYERAAQRLADLNLKIAYYNSTQGSESGYLSMMDYTRIQEMRISGKDIAHFADSQLLRRGIDPSRMSIHAKAKSLYGNLVSDQLYSLMYHRNSIIKEYMTFQHSDIAEGVFSINDIVLEDMSGYKGKDRYTVTLLVDGEEMEVESDDVEESVDEEYYDAYALEDVEGTDVAQEDNLMTDTTLVEMTENVASNSEDDMLDSQEDIDTEIMN